MNAAATELRARLDELFRAKDRPAAVTAALTAVRDGRLGVVELYDEVLTPLLIDTGTDWQRGTTQIWEEHFASATVRTIVEALYPDVIAQSASAPANDRTVLLVCPPQEHHDLGLRMLTDRFALGGWNAVFLGADTPIAEMTAAASALGASLVVLSASTHFNRLHLRSVVDKLKAGLPGIRVAVGGPAFALDHEWPADELLSLDEIGASTNTHATADPDGGA